MAKKKFTRDTLRPNFKSTTSGLGFRGWGWADWGGGGTLTNMSDPVDLFFEFELVYLLLLCYRLSYLSHYADQEK